MNKVYTRINWKNYPSIDTAINESNLNRMDSALNEIDTRVVEHDTTKANVASLNELINYWHIDETTGVITIRKVSGEQIIFDLNIEKVPVGFSMTDDGILIMTTDDGTEFTANIGSMIPVLTFNDSEQIAVAVSGEGVNKSYTFTIKTGSITEDKLQPNFLADCRLYAGNAEESATLAGEYAQKAKESAESVLDNFVDAGSDTTPVFFEGGKPVAIKYILNDACERGVKTLTTAGNLGWGTNNDYLPDLAMLARWNGAHSGTTSNLAYCNKGAFGTAAIKGVDTTATSGSGNLITSGAMYTALANKMALKPAIIEMTPPTTATYGGIIDFHYAGSNADYTTRLYESASGKLTCTGNLLVGGGTMGFSGTGCIYGASSNPFYISTTGERVSSLGTAGSYRFGPDNFQPGKDNTIILGSGNYRWKQLVAGTTTISTSDRNSKDNINKLSDIYYQLFLKLLPVSFTFKDGESGRTHIGFIAQDVEAALKDLGLTGIDFAGFCKDVKTKSIVEEYTKLDEEGNIVLDEEGNPKTYTIDNEIPDLDKNGNEQYIYSLRYSEFIAMITDALQRTIKRQDALEERICMLEQKLG